MTSVVVRVLQDGGSAREVERAGLPATPSVLSAMIETVRGWLRRGGDDAQRSVHLEIDGDVLKLGQATADQQERLVQDWLRRRGGTDSDGGA